MVNYATKGNKSLNDYGIYNPVMEKLKKMAKEGNKPDFNICTPIKTGDEKVFWQKIGAAWKVDKGISVTLNALPLSESIMLFPYTEKKD